MKVMEHNNDAGPIMLGLTVGFWIIQKFAILAGAIPIANIASFFTIITSICASAFYIYSIYKKSKEK